MLKEAIAIITTPIIGMSLKSKALSKKNWAMT